ncbi:cell wall-binding repeat-containing protein [Corynebacterium imitans]|uniref:cell wall-binding repeat-containing protein n=1 Tax=Corynebacterium imitans TaxID=156978 RepID=UPI00254AB5E0|nr:cell wall-binding repeat-containing protein [Corynebacterium imitans]MDK8637560.1 cell wall-binding repeat-containing protein [Corynebacterium imitans]MDK8772861.1 cell wall-binding repeat-containing protein [Corynebacterium imitans]
MRLHTSRARVVSACALIAALVMTVLGLTGAFQQVSGSPEAAGEGERLATDGSEVIADADGTGVEVSKRLFDAADAVVVAGPKREDQLRAAAIAVEKGVPLLTRWPNTDAAVDEEITRLGAETVIEVPSKDAEADEAAPVESPAPEQDAASIAALDAPNAQDRQLPPMLASPQTSRAAAATARAAGAEIEVVAAPDPRATSTSMRTVAEQDTLALGRQWGTTEDFQSRIELAANGELPGGGGLVFPGRRMIALYGHAFAPELGIMGEQPPAEAAALAKEYAEKYQPLADEPVIPAFEIIVTVASNSPGEDGDYSNEADPAAVVPYIDAITEAGGYAVIDLQPGQGDFLHQVRLYEELLKRPNVGLALDAEWKLNPGEEPLSRVGSATAEEINVVADWLAEFTREHNLPQKAFVLHQFQLGMFPDRENIRTDHDELAYILHADGHGTPGQKFETWDLLRKDLDPGFYMAWKNFIDEDEPTFSPEQTFNEVSPRPWFVSYQ